MPVLIYAPSFLKGHNNYKLAMSKKIYMQVMRRFCHYKVVSAFPDFFFNPVSSWVSCIRSYGYMVYLQEVYTFKVD